jgi:hypothetical protein
MNPRKKPAVCPCCAEKGLDRRLKPYCSIVCRTLGQAGLGWRRNPYRIVDLQSGATLSTGPGFGLTLKGIADLQRKAERLRQKQPAVPNQALAMPTRPLFPSRVPEMVMGISR